MSLGGWEGIPDWPMLLRLESSPRRGPEWRGRRTTYHCSLVLPWEDLSHILGDAGTLKLQPLTLVHDLVLQDKGHPWRRDPRWSIHSIPMIPPPPFIPPQPLSSTVTSQTLLLLKTMAPPKSSFQGTHTLTTTPILPNY